MPVLLAGGGFRQQLEGPGLRRLPAQVGQRQPELIGDGRREVALVQHPELHQQRAEPFARCRLLQERLGDLGVGDELLLHEQVPQLRRARQRRPAIRLGEVCGRAGGLEPGLGRTCLWQPNDVRLVTTVFNDPRFTEHISSPLFPPRRPSTPTLLI